MTPPSKYFQVISAVFVTVLVISNIIAVKVGDFWGLFVPVAVIIFPLSYIIGDVLTEVYGYASARRVIWLGFGCNLIAVLVVWIGKLIPAAPFFDAQGAYERILGATPRIFLASVIAYLVGEFINSFVLAKMKVKTSGRFLWLRTITSTILGEGFDSLIFISLAFWGVFQPSQIFTMVVTQWLIKVLIESAATPVTYLVVNLLKKRENTDVFDTHTNFNPLKF